MLKKTLLISTALLIGGCSQNALLEKPQPQKMTVEKVDKASQKGAAKLYLCKDDKKVSVVHSTQKKNKKTLKRVTVTFNEVTERLTMVISERGNNYGNIRWTWQEREDLSTLKTSVGVILAEQCVLKESELLEK
ncbi:MliC family protein [Rodentibacter myodis]|uniref:Opacity-associated protein OapB n=1 Tax=Rodentibacter myodis TaxID=1907939 RepID=A0A1V3JT52_9PAST|nr:MliC family protein [Rodentibacter myodis]OOF59966.1 Opacity-associated protein OapB [Rodentibacter myodis]